MTVAVAQCRLAEVDMELPLWVRIGEAIYRTMPNLPKSRHRENAVPCRLYGRTEIVHLSKNTPCEVIGLSL